MERSESTDPVYEPHIPPVEFVAAQNTSWFRATIVGTFVLAGAKAACRPSTVF
jgi:hypothetical protein